MKLNQLADKAGARKVGKRVGRGVGSGKGKTSTRGHKGQKARSGVSIKGFEGGQMPFFRRLPKRGFYNKFGTRYEVVNLGRLQRALDEGKLDASKPVTEATLKEAGLARGRRDGVRILADGELKASLKLEVSGASKAAVQAVEKAGGSISVRVAPKSEGESAKKSPKKTKSGGKAKAEGTEGSPSKDGGADQSKDS